MNAWQAGMVVAGRRLVCRRGAVALLAAALCVVVGAWMERGRPLPVASAEVLRGITLGLVLPVFVYSVVARVSSTGALGSAVGPLARAGLSRRSLLLSVSLVVEALAAAAGAALALLAFWAVSRPDGSSAGLGLAAVLLLGAAAGASYAALFCWGATIGTKGGGKTVILGLDWVLGMSSSAWALPWPRAHLRNLLGGEAVLGLPSWASVVALILLIFVANGWTAARTPP